VARRPTARDRRPSPRPGSAANACGPASSSSRARAARTIDGLVLRALDQHHDADEARGCVALASVCGELLAQVALAAAGAVAVAQAMEA